MEIYIREGTQLLGTYRDGTLYAAPGIDRERLAFELFRAMNEALNPAITTTVTMGHAFWPAANQGGA